MLLLYLVAKACPTLCSSLDCSPPGSSAHGIFKARILEKVAISYPGVFLTQGLKPCLLHLLHWQVDSLLLTPPGMPHSRYTGLIFFKHSRDGYILGSVSFCFCFFDHFQIRTWLLSRNTFNCFSNFTFVLKAFTGHFSSKSALLQFSSSLFFLFALFFSIS